MKYSINYINWLFENKYLLARCLDDESRLTDRLMGPVSTSVIRKGKAMDLFIDRKRRFNTFFDNSRSFILVFHPLVPSFAYFGRDAGTNAVIKPLTYERKFWDQLGIERDWNVYGLNNKANLILSGLSEVYASLVGESSIVAYEREGIVSSKFIDKIRSVDEIFLANNIKENHRLVHDELLIEFNMLFCIGIIYDERGFEHSPHVTSLLAKINTIKQETCSKLADCNLLGTSNVIAYNRTFNNLFVMRYFREEGQICVVTNESYKSYEDDLSHLFACKAASNEFLMNTFLSRQNRNVMNAIECNDLDHLKKEFELLSNSNLNHYNLDVSSTFPSLDEKLTGKIGNGVLEKALQKLREDALDLKESVKTKGMCAQEAFSKIIGKYNYVYFSVCDYNFFYYYHEEIYATGLDILFIRLFYKIIYFLIFKKLKMTMGINQHSFLLQHFTQ